MYLTQHTKISTYIYAMRYLKRIIIIIYCNADGGGGGVWWSCSVDIVLAQVSGVYFLGACSRS